MKLKVLVENAKNKFKKIPKSFIGVIIAILVLISPLLSNKVTFGHDYVFHVTSNLVNHGYLNIFEFKFFLPKIFGSTIANGFGYGTGIFYPPLSYHLTSYISYFLNLSYQNSVLAISYSQILILILSGVVMYKFVKRISSDNYVAALSSVSYISYTYFLCTLYTRCAIGEGLMSIFLPLVLYGLYELFYGDDKKFIPLFVIGYTGMILSHLVLSVFITIIILIIFLFNIKKVLKKEKIKKLVISSILILLITSPFTVPLLEHKIYGNYTVFAENTMYDTETIKASATNILDFLVVKPKTANGIEVYIGYVTLFTMLIVIYKNKEIFQKENRSIYKNLLLLIIISLVLSSRIIPWNKMPYFLKIIQFPWRLCMVASLGISILSGYFIKLVDKEHKKKLAVLIVILTIFFGYATIAREYIIEPLVPYEMSLGNQKEYLPVKTNNNLEYFYSRNQEIIFKEGTGEIKIIENETPYLKSEINISSNNLIIELPRLYYLGYEIKLTDKDGVENKLDYYESEYGFIELHIIKNGTLEIDYTGTTANKIANYVSIITIISLISILIYNKIK